MLDKLGYNQFYFDHINNRNTSIKKLFKQFLYLQKLKMFIIVLSKKYIFLKDNDMRKTYFVFVR